MTFYYPRSALSIRLSTLISLLPRGNLGVAQIPGYTYFRTWRLEPAVSARWRCSRSTPRSLSSCVTSCSPDGPRTLPDRTSSPRLRPGDRQRATAALKSADVRCTHVPVRREGAVRRLLARRQREVTRVRLHPNSKATRPPARERREFASGASPGAPSSDRHTLPNNRPGHQRTRLSRPAPRPGIRRRRGPSVAVRGTADGAHRP